MGTGDVPRRLKLDAWHRVIVVKVPYQWTSAGIGIATAVIIFYLVRRDRMQVRYALWWLLVAAGAALFGVFPQWVNTLGILLGIHYPPILLVILALSLLFIKSLTQDIDRCRREQNMRRLAQRIALLEGRLEEMAGRADSASSVDDPENTPNLGSEGS